MSDFDIEAEYADLILSHQHLGPNDYTAMDRYRDFSALFLGSDLGRRVLYQIIRRGHALHATAVLGRFETNRAFFLSGESSLANWILAKAREEPKAQPGMQNKTPEE